MGTHYVPQLFQIIHAVALWKKRVACLQGFFSQLWCLVSFNQTLVCLPSWCSLPVRMWTWWLHLGADQNNHTKSLWRRWFWFKLIPEWFMMWTCVARHTTKPAIEYPTAHVSAGQSGSPKPRPRYKCNCWVRGVKIYWCYVGRTRVCVQLVDHQMCICLIGLQ